MCIATPKGQRNVRPYHVDVDFSGLDKLFVAPVGLKGNSLGIAATECVCVCVCERELIIYECI